MAKEKWTVFKDEYEAKKKTNKWKNNGIFLGWWKWPLKKGKLENQEKETVAGEVSMSNRWCILVQERKVW